MCQAAELPGPMYSALLRPRPLDTMHVTSDGFTWVRSGRTTVCQFLAQEICSPLATCTGQRQKRRVTRVKLRPLLGSTFSRGCYPLPWFAFLSATPPSTSSCSESYRSLSCLLSNGPITKPRQLVSHLSPPLPVPSTFYLGLFLLPGASEEEAEETHTQTVHSTKDVYY